MTIITNCIQITLTFLILFFLCFMWLNYYHRSLLFCMVLAILIAMITTTILHLYKQKKERQQRKQKQKKKVVSNFGLQLLLSSPQQQQTILSPILTPHCYLLFAKQVITFDDILPLIQQHNKMAIFCYDFDPIILKMIKRLPSHTIQLYNHEDIYQQLSEQNCLPQLPTIYEEEKHPTIRYLFSQALVKEKAKSYMLTGLFLAITSFWTKYHIWYIIFSSLLLLLSLYCLLNKRYNIKK